MAQSEGSTTGAANMVSISTGVAVGKPGAEDAPSAADYSMESMDATMTDGDEDGDDVEETTSGEPQAKRKKTKGRVKIKMEFISNKLRRYTTFSKRKTGIMKKAYELSTLTGTQIMLLVASETGHVYTFATPKLQPMITSESGKALIQTCLNTPDASDEPGTSRMVSTGYEETDLAYPAVEGEDDEKDDSADDAFVDERSLSRTVAQSISTQAFHSAQRSVDANRQPFATTATAAILPRPISASVSTGAPSSGSAFNPAPKSRQVAAGNNLSSAMRVGEQYTQQQAGLAGVHEPPGGGNVMVATSTVGTGRGNDPYGDTQTIVISQRQPMQSEHAENMRAAFR